MIGGSLCGLFAGISLSRLKHKVQILERSSTPTLPARGAGIVSGADIEAFFSKHLGSNPKSIVNDGRIHLDVAGEVSYYESRIQRTTSWTCLYAELHKMFEDSTNLTVSHGTSERQKRAYRYGCTFLSFESVGARLEVKFKNEEGSLEMKVVDVMIGADGAKSTTRASLLPSIQPKYVGYAAWRGIVLEKDVSSTTVMTCAEKICFFFSEGLQVVVYTIPMANDADGIGTRLFNWLWYTNYEPGTRAFEELMTDCDGNRRESAIPAGKVNKCLWEKQKQISRQCLPPQFVELIDRTAQPFVQCITDVITSQVAFHDGKVLLIGDAVAAFRPHTGASTNQAAFHALKLEEYFQRRINLKQLEEQIMDHASNMFKIGVKMGNHSQFGVSSE